MSKRTEESQSNLEQVVRIVRHRWWLMLACVVIAGGVAVGLSLLQRKQYTASASLLFRNPGFDQMVFGSSLFGPVQDPARQAATNLDLVLLPTVAARTSAALQGLLTPAQVRSEVSASPSGQADVATVAASDPSPVRAARVANAYAQQYILLRQEADRAKIAGAQRQIRNQLAQLTRHQRNGAVGASLLNRANQLGVLASLQTGNAELVQTANVPNAPSSPRTKRNGIIGALLGLLLGFALALLAERFDRRLRDASDVEEAYGVPVIGVVAESSAYDATHAGAPLPAIEAESFGLLRARLRYFNVDRVLRSLLITSAVPGDGKSTIALQLAIAEATAGSAEVVLVEADLRRPSLAERLGISPAPGLAEVLSRSVTLEQALRRVAVPSRSKSSASQTHLHVLLAGAIPPNPAELIESQSMRELLMEIADRFPLAIVDSPPVAVVSDAIPLMSQVSGVVIVSRIGKTTRDAARHLREQLDQLGAATLGVVANAIPVKSRGYYGYSSGYGYDGYTQSLSAAAESSDILDDALVDKSGVEPESNGDVAQAPTHPAGRR